VPILTPGRGKLPGPVFRCVESDSQAQSTREQLPRTDFIDLGGIQLFLGVKFQGSTWAGLKLNLGVPGVGLNPRG
jgi:hypothetical protein